MTIWILLTIISSVALIIFIIWGVVSDWDGLLPYVVTTIIFTLMIVGAISIYQKVTLRSEVLRQTKERQQILYQIENMTEDNDKVKLNEWILTYNDWVNDVTTNQELYGWFSWYAGVDMTAHTIIELV